MTRPLDQLRINLTDESKAYGYTLVIWGSGAALINAFGFPATSHILLYIIGALAGFALLAAPVYGGFLGRIPNRKDEEMIVASMIHLIAALGAITVATQLAVMLPADTAFFLCGVNASVTYNLLMLVEVAFSEELASHPWHR